VPITGRATTPNEIPSAPAATANGNPARNPARSPFVRSVMPPLAEA
jgi:hypothetical protein